VQKRLWVALLNLKPTKRQNGMNGGKKKATVESKRRGALTCDRGGKCWGLRKCDGGGKQEKKEEKKRG